jgi:hypothetical protein
MWAGRRTRLPALVGAIVLLTVVGALVARFVRPEPEAGAGAAACPRDRAQTRLAATLLWENAGGSMAPAPEVRRLKPAELTSLVDSEDAESCRRLLASLPDSIAPGALSRHQVGFYRAGDVYIVAVVANHTPRDLDDRSRADASIDRAGETRVYGRDFRLLARYSN